MIHLSNFSMTLQTPIQHLQAPVQHFQQPEMRLEKLDFLGVASFCVLVELRTSWFFGVVVSFACVLEELLTSWLTDILSTTKEIMRGVRLSHPLHYHTWQQR